MRKLIRYMPLVPLALLAAYAPPSQTFELATTIEEANGAVIVDAQGYARMNLVRVEVHHKGNITLNGAVAVQGGEANIVLWSKVQGKYYFSRLPELQGFNRTDFSGFAIPFSSPELPITEAVLEVELPNGGKLQIKDLELSKD